MKKEATSVICKRLLALALILAAHAVCISQDQTSGGPDSIIAGPFGEPRMVMSEGGQWSNPIKVFADSEVETFVPDITSPGWIAWHAAEFRERGTYVTYLYVYHRKTRRTGRETIYVDTRAGTALVVRPLLSPFRIHLSKAPLDLSKSIARITALVANNVERFNGSTVEESNLSQRILAARMASCAGPGKPDPDCDLSDAEYIAKHPIYAKNPLQLFPGAAPGANCGIGTDKSCYVGDPRNLTSPRPGSGTRKDPVIAASGLYRVGGRVSAPVAIFQAEAEFSDEARRAKYQGVCLVSVIVDGHGNPQNPRIVRGLRMGLDQKALDAVRKYKFRPAMLDGEQPVPVMITIEINFKLY